MDRRAFSLIELVIVIAVIGVVSAIVIPRYGAAQDRYRADGAAQRLVLDIAQARADARATSSSREVWYDAATNHYEVCNTATHPGYIYVELDDAPFGATIQSATLGGDASIIFNGFGVPDSGGTIVVKVGRQVRTITVSPGTGATSIQASIQSVSTPPPASPMTP